MHLKKYWLFLKILFDNWSQDRVSTQAAALSYYALFSLAPILLICIFIVGMIYGDDVALQQIMQQINGLIGIESGLKIQEILQNANKPTLNLLTKIMSISVLIFTASGIFSEIQEGLNIIWGVKSNPDMGWFAKIKNRCLSFAMVLGVALLLLFSLLLSTILMLLSGSISHFMGMNILIDVIISYSLSFFINTLLFAMIFKFLPDIELDWHDVWVGALITSLLFSMGKIGIGMYLNQFHIYSIFGAAGSLIIILIWIFYSAQIFFIGAEITKILSKSRGKKIIPKNKAILI